MSCEDKNVSMPVTIFFFNHICTNNVPVGPIIRR